MGNAAAASAGHKPEAAIVYRAEFGVALGRDDDRIAFASTKAIRKSDDGPRAQEYGYSIPKTHGQTTTYLRGHIGRLALKALTRAPFVDVSRRNNNGFVGIAAGREYAEKGG